MTTASDEEVDPTVDLAKLGCFEPLIFLLRSDFPLPISVRTWLAEIFDPFGSSEHRIHKLTRRKRGRPHGGKRSSLALAVQDVVISIDATGKLEPLIREATQNYAVSRSAIMNELRRTYPQLGQIRRAIRKACPKKVAK
ncbi:MAG: hypothetical protein ACHQAY_05370 [Hyphomicrobiales bacterium]